MLFAILVAWSFEPHVWRRRLVYGVATFYIVMSQSTTALALLLVIVPLGILFHRIARADAAGRSAILVSSLAAGALVGLVLVTVAEALLATRGKDLTLTRRTVIWDGVWQAIERRPIAGYGAGGVWLDLGREPARSILRPLGFPVFHSHNGYLEVALHLGLVGLALVLVLMGLVFAFGVAESAHDARLGTFMMLYVVLIAVTSLTEVAMLGIWLAVLCALQTISVQRRQSRRPATPGRRPPVAPPPLHRSAAS
jgi:O-antigen ligase